MKRGTKIHVSQLMKHIREKIQQTIGKNPIMSLLHYWKHHKFSDSIFCASQLFLFLQIRRFIIVFLIFNYSQFPFLPSSVIVIKFFFSGFFFFSFSSCRTKLYCNFNPLHIIAKQFIVVTSVSTCPSVHIYPTYPMRAPTVHIYPTRLCHLQYAPWLIPTL